MRRALLLAVLAAPAAATALAPIPGQIVFSEGSGDLVHGQWISLAECDASKTAPASAAAQVDVSWTLPSFPAAGTYQLFASTAEVTGTSCLTSNSTSPEYRAGPVGPSLGNLGATVYLQPVRFADIFAAIAVADCASIPGDTPIWVCAQAYDSNRNEAGIATGRITLSSSAPGAPTNVTAVPADDGALQIAWSMPAGDSPAYDYRIVVQAEPPDARDPAVHEATGVRALSHVMSGLVNDVPYGIRVYARSQAGNESAPSTEAIATPLRPACMLRCAIPSPPGGGGGCASGGAGPIALLALAALLARRRRGR